ncbi:chitin synthase 6 [Phlyctochytrium arcticum]|nr:chitin synthase 6 [Phlyctochytrium arcticum]
MSSSRPGSRPQSRASTIAKTNKVGIDHLPPPRSDGPITGESHRDEDLRREFPEEDDAKKKYAIPPPSPIKKKKKEKKERVPDTRTFARRWWVRYTWCVTWWIPTAFLKCCGGMYNADIRQAWREKVALCVVILIMCGTMIFFVQFFSKILCPNAKIMSREEISRHNKIGARNNNIFVSWNGYVYDVNAYYDKHPAPSETILKMAGMDVSEYFPRVNPKTFQMHPTCPQASLDSFEMTLTNTTCVKSGFKNGYCHPTFTLDTSINVLKETEAFPIFKVATVAYPRISIYDHSSKTDAWILMDNKFYNVTDLVSGNSEMSQLFPADFITRLDYYRGKDGSNLLASLDANIRRCMENQFFIGVVDDRLSAAACYASEYILLGCTGIMVFILVVKFLAALQLGSKRQPENHDRFVIMQVPCYTEGEDSLKKTINSLALLEYDDTRKLLFIVADGIVQGAGNDRPTPDLVLQTLGMDPNTPAEPMEYVAIAEGSKGYNRAKVYSGLYHIHARAIPFIVIVKCGKEGDTSKAGNRGKRDSQMILMKFLNKVHYRSPMTPLDLEMFHHMKNIIGVHPYLYEYILMVDADTEVVPDSLNRLISCMVHDGKIMGICGETKIANEKQSWVTMMQVYEYFISHHMAKAFESLFGSVTCLPGCFSMYRVRTPEKKVPLLISNDIIQDYQENLVDTLHKKNLLALGEDRYLTTLMLKYFPEFRTKFTADAKCLTIVPERMSILLSQRRRWINSTIHNLFELLFLPQLCGCMIFSMRFVVFLDLFATLIMPATTGYLIYLIIAAVQSREAPILSLVMLAAAYGLQAIIFIVKREYQHLGWMIINILAMPVFSFWLPLYSFWHFDDFSWGNTRKIAGATGKDDHAGDKDIFDPSIVPLMTFEAYEEQYLKDETSKGEYPQSDYGGGPGSEYGGGGGSPNNRGRPTSAYSMSVYNGGGQQQQQQQYNQNPVRRRASVRSGVSAVSGHTDRSGPAINYGPPSNNNNMYPDPYNNYGGGGGGGEKSRPSSVYSQYTPNNVPHTRGPASTYSEAVRYPGSTYAPSHADTDRDYQGYAQPHPHPQRAIGNIRNSALFHSNMALDRLPGAVNPIDGDPSQPNQPHYSITPGMNGYVDGNLRGGRSRPASQLMLSSMDNVASTDRLLSSEESARLAGNVWPGGVPTDEDIVERVRYVISISDLHSLTKRKVRDELSQFFGQDLSEKRQFISDQVERIVTGGGV